MTGLRMTCSDLTCRAPMVRRMNRRTGSAFYGCSLYPDCRATTEIPELEKLIAAGAAPLPGFDLDEGGQQLD